MPERCPKCGCAKRFFYNGGMPVYGCFECYMKTQLIVNDHTEYVKGSEDDA